MDRLERIIGIAFALPGILVAAFGEIRDMFKR